MNLIDRTDFKEDVKQKPALEFYHSSSSLSLFVFVNSRTVVVTHQTDLCSDAADTHTMRKPVGRHFSSVNKCFVMWAPDETE